MKQNMTECEFPEHRTPDLLGMRREDLEEKLLEGLRSEDVEVNEAFWQVVRDEALKM